MADTFVGWGSRDQVLAGEHSHMPEVTVGECAHNPEVLAVEHSHIPEAASARGEAQRRALVQHGVPLVGQQGVVRR